MTLRMHGTVLGLWGSLAVLASGSVFAGANDNWYTGASCQQTGTVASTDLTKKVIDGLGFMNWYGPAATFICPTNQNRGMTTGQVTPWVQIADGTSAPADVSCSATYFNGQSNYYVSRIDTLKSGSLVKLYHLQFPTVSWYYPYWSHYTISCSLPAGSTQFGGSAINLYGVYYNP